MGSSNEMRAFLWGSSPTNPAPLARPTPLRSPLLGWGSSVSPSPLTAAAARHLLLTDTDPVPLPSPSAVYASFNLSVD